ncbi:MAG: hypothetical protein J6Q22_18075 [Prevotella sp.]|nr:hypothetical protein [Prevotella sp.]
MTTKKNLVKQVLMSTLTAGIFAFSFSSCSDDLDSPNAGANDQQAPEGAQTELLEAYGLTFKNFISESDVVILDADTTQLSISKAYAEKMGITSFVNHPMGIWHRVENLPYIRKATGEKLVGDRFIVDVVPATIAEVMGDKQVNLRSDIYVNNDTRAVKTRAAGSDIPEYAAKYIDENEVLHPAYVHMTDPYGYDKKSHTADEQPSAAQTRAAASGVYQYMSADELAGGQTRWGCNNRIISFKDNLEHQFDFPLGKGSKDSLYVKVSTDLEFGLNYFITLNGGMKWNWCIPTPYLKKFEAGIDGNIGFKAELSLGWEKKWELKKDKWREQLFTFSGYTFTFFVGPIPVAITSSPHLDIAMDGEVGGGINMSFNYEYANTFKGGFGWADGQGFYGITDFQEKKNEFDMDPLCITIAGKAGIGLYLACDLKIYGLAGPKLGVGPRLGGEFELALSPYKQEASLKAKIGLSINAVIGAKVDILGYEIADKSLTFQLAGPWTLWKYNWELEKDEEIHKSPEAKKEESKMLSLMPKFRQALDKAVNGNFGPDYNLLANMLMTLKGYTYQQAEEDILKYTLKRFPSFETDENILQLEAKLRLCVTEYANALSPKYNAIMGEKSWQEIQPELKQSPAYEKYSNYFKDFRVSLDLDLIRKQFVKEHDREPANVQKDIMTLVGYMQHYAKIYCQNNPSFMKRYDPTIVPYLIKYGNKGITEVDRERAAYETLLLLKVWYGNTDFTKINWNEYVHTSAASQIRWAYSQCEDNMVRFGH